ncbi:hypothetical protein HX109_15510 [Galbibacter sp. BG1]|uniref:hypothetical protein n=1 Tax=Galbibacter sp. BG1 TaxID=1170699 RepID=UPI0015B882CA|nr:hypothetical protein [Galbibacter sp. BG1]QLE02907.1 hypothetical protein HX109_15510 [Galbibacter sp. BG1]
MDGLINVSDFVDYMKNEGLVLVKKQEAENIAMFKEAKMAELRSHLRRKKTLKFSEIAKGGFFGVYTRKGVEYVVKNMLSENEYFKSGAGKQDPILVLTSAVVRISKLKGIIYE